MRRAGCLALAFAVAAPALAHDRYEFDIGASVPDDTFVTYVELLHGQTQYHDLEATTPADQDWTFVQETLRHSYEVVVTNSPMRFASAPTSGFATMNRVDELGAILTAGAPAVIYDGAFAARWIAETAQPLGYSYVKVEGEPGMGAESGYEIQMRDTTYLVPRWNNTASQLTVFQVQNTRNVVVTGKIYFYDGGGTLVHTVDLSVPAYGLFVLNTASQSELANLSGSAQIAQTGGYGALAGKAVALEPATGFTFDTAITPLPY